MMGMLWMVLLVALASSQSGHGLPVKSTPLAYPHDPSTPSVFEGWGAEGGLYAAIPALALVITAVGLLFGCTWCYRHKDCKPNEGAENQLFSASATHLHDGRRSNPPDSGFSEPVNNNISEDNNNGPISLREMQNIANNNAAAYIVSENEERNRVSRESVVEFEPLPAGIRVADPLEHCADWFGGEDFPRNRLQYLREFARGWFGRVVEGEIDEDGSTTTVAVKILNQNASLEDKARFLDEARVYRDISHENILAFVAKCLHEDPWILIFELCSMDLRQYLTVNRPKMAALNEAGIPLRLMCDASAALAHLHSRGYYFVTGPLCTDNVLVRGTGESARAVLGNYRAADRQHEFVAPECRRHPPAFTASSEVWSLGTLIWEISTWGATVPSQHSPPSPEQPCLYRNHLYQVMQLCWNPDPTGRPTAAQVEALVNHLYTTHAHAQADTPHDDGYGSSDFEERWQRLKPNTIPKIDEHVAIVHAPSTSMASHFTGSDQEFTNVQTIQDTLSVDMDTAISRSSSIMSDKDPLSVQIKSESLNNLHGSLEDVRNIYLTHNETAVLECHQGNIGFDDSRDKDLSDSSVDPWLKDIIAGSQDDVSYYRDVSDVIKNLDNILNSEKTSSSESSHQASPSRDNLSLDCKKDYPVQSSMVKSPGISNFQNVLEMGFESSKEVEPCEEEVDRDTIGTLSHSFERHSDTVSQHTLENLTPDTPIKDFEIVCHVDNQNEIERKNLKDDIIVDDKADKSFQAELPKDKIDCSDSIPKLKELCVASMSSVSEKERLNVREDCKITCDNNLTEVRTDTEVITKSIDNTTIGNIEEKSNTQIVSIEEVDISKLKEKSDDIINDAVESMSDVEPLNDHGDIFLSKLVKQDDAEKLGNEIKPSVDFVQSATNLEELSPKFDDPEIKDVLSCNHTSSINLPVEQVVSSSSIETKNIEAKHDAKFNEILTNTDQHLDNSVPSIESTNVCVPDELLSNVTPETKANEAKTDSKEIHSPKEIKKSANPAHDIPCNDSIIVNNIANKENLVNEINFEGSPKEELLTSKVDNVSNDTNDTITPLNDLVPTAKSIVPVQTLNNVDEKGFRDIADAEMVLNRPTGSRETQIIKPIIPEFDIEVTCESIDLESEEKFREGYLPFETIEIDSSPLSAIQTPEKVQNIINNKPSLDSEKTDVIDNLELEIKPAPILPPEEVQIMSNNLSFASEEQGNKATLVEDINSEIRSDTKGVTEQQENDSTVYMDLINDTNSEIIKDTIDNNVRDVIKSCISATSNESTVYLDLPSVLKETDNFLNSERAISCETVKPNNRISSSTPKGSDISTENTLENSKMEKEAESSDTKVQDYSLGVTLTKMEQKYVPETLSPFESPTKSHPTDTYDENSSVVLGPFENCTVELYKGVKSELVDLPKEELLAFSSNFSEINLETPSPLRDANFLNEVPDIVQDDLQFDDITISEVKNEPEKTEPQTDNTDETDQSGTAKRVSPSTPPNSPGIFLASTSQQKYLVDIDFEPPLESIQSYPPLESDSGLSSLQKEIDLNQIELQITSKLAMAENENNMNIEYSGPLTVEGLVSEEGEMLRDSDAIPESYLAGNGGSIEDLREGFTLDEECMKALRNELELKLPLAQVAAIEPTCEAEGGLDEGEGEGEGGGEAQWGELPPPPELVVSYCGAGAGALSPIAEETRHQLSAYENDAWNTSIRTDSSESYPEPCNNSTDEVTDLPTGAPDHGTYTLHSDPHTYTLHKDLPTSNEMTMSADSLNGSPQKNVNNDAKSPIDDRTYNKNDEEKECERISQVSPFLMSPTTDTSAPVDSDINATGVSTLSKTTVPTDAKLSKASECLSKATSIDSWCSNDTLYNVEENFDDLAMDPDVPLDFEQKVDKSDSTDTLTHDEEKEASHCSTYIIHDSKSDACDTFSPDSITANDNYTYTKVKTEAVVTEAKSDVNDSTKNTQTKDLAYGTLPSYSNCTTELVSGFDDPWKLAQPELVRRSPIADEVSLTPPRMVEEKPKTLDETPQIVTEPSIKKMDSVDISCLNDDVIDSQNKTENSDGHNALVDVEDSPKCNYNRNMAPSVTSTPLIELVMDDPNMVPNITVESPEYIMNNIPNFLTFQQSAEIRPQDISPNESSEPASINQCTDSLLEGESKTLSRNSNRDSLPVSERTPTYSDFESSAICKPQEVCSKDKSSQSMESGMSSGDFRQFESSVRSRPQDLSSVMDASSMLLKSERKSAELPMGNSTCDLDHPSQSGSRGNDHEILQTIDISPPNVTNLNESHVIDNIIDTDNVYITDLDMEEETDQPHSIIITEIAKDFSMRPNVNNDTYSVIKIPEVSSVSNDSNDSPNKTYDSHTGANVEDINHTFDSHTHERPIVNIAKENEIEQVEQPKVNGISDANEATKITEDSLKTDTIGDLIDVCESKSIYNNMASNHQKDIPNGSLSEDLVKVIDEEIKCNGDSEKYATVNFLNETFEELMESNVDDDGKDVNNSKDVFPSQNKQEEKLKTEVQTPVENESLSTDEASPKQETYKEDHKVNGELQDKKMTSVTENFLQNEKKFCQLDSYLPLLNDIRFTGPATEIMSTSFTQDSPTEPTSPECEQDSKPNSAGDIIKEWDSDSESHSSNSSSGEFIWKQRGGSQASGPEGGGRAAEGSGAPSEGSGDSGSGSEGDEVEFVPSSWDCRAAPAKSSLRSLEQAPPDNKKRVVFKRQKYHCVYEYPREVADVDTHSPATYLPDLSTYCEWDPTSAEEAELGYGQLYSDLYPLRAGIAFGADFDDDFFISSSARPFESLGIMTTTSQFFPGMHVKPALLERELPDDFPPPPSPLTATSISQTRTPSLDFTTPDSGVEDITPGSTSTDEDFKTKKLPESEIAPTWKPVDSGSSSESVSPSSPGGEALGGLRHTRDKLKLDLPPSPHIPSPRHNRVFNFVLDKPKRHRVPDERPAEVGTTPLVMTDETPIITTSLPLQKEAEEVPVPEPTFSTFGKSTQKSADPEQKMILTDEVQEEVSSDAKVESPVKAVEAVKGEGTVLDSGDEDSGIESSSKATLERNKTPNVS